MLRRTSAAPSGPCRVSRRFRYVSRFIVNSACESIALEDLFDRLDASERLIENLGTNTAFRRFGTERGQPFAEWRGQRCDRCKGSGWILGHDDCAGAQEHGNHDGGDTRHPRDCNRRSSLDEVDSLAADIESGEFLMSQEVVMSFLRSAAVAALVLVGSTPAFAQTPADYQAVLTRSAARATSRTAC